VWRLYTEVVIPVKAGIQLRNNGFRVKARNDKQRKWISDSLHLRERGVREERKPWIILRKSIPPQCSLSTARIMFGVDFFLLLGMVDFNPK